MRRPAHSFILLGTAFGLVLSLFLSGPLMAQAAEQDESRQSLDQGPYNHAEAPTARAVRTSESITIDGVLDEPAWMTAPAITQFRQTQPEEGNSVSQPTEVRFLYDDEYLYVGGWMWDDGEVLTRLARRDAGLPDVDVFAIHLDSYHDHRTAYRFATSPSGWIRDEFVVGGRGRGFGGPGGGSDASWDPIWETKATVTDEGWFVEMAIPFSQLRYTSDDVQTWGLQVERKIRRRGEDNVWAFVPRNQPQGVARYGHLEGLQGLKQGKRLEVLPYSTGRAEYRVVPRSDGVAFDNPFRTGSDYFGSVGADLKYRLGTNFTLDATVNPDFGQVEQDPAVINLTAIETRFNEKRPFFVEGSDIFQFGEGGRGGGMRGGGDAQLLYSRRIGRAPQGAVPSEAEYSDVPAATTILGAAKVTGRTTSGWSMGLLDAVSNREVVPWVDAEGNRSRSEVEPLTNSLVARARRDMAEGTRAFGFIGTAVNRGMNNEDLQDRLRSSAYAGGADSHLEWADRAWSLDARVAGSLVQGSADAISRTQLSSARYLARPDADHLSYDSTSTSMAGFFGKVALDKQNGAWQGGTELTATSPGFEVNDLGFLGTTDRFEVQGNFGYRIPTTTPHFRNFNVNASAHITQNFGGETVEKQVGVNFGLTHISQNGINGRVNRNFASWNDRLTRGGPLTFEPAGWSGNFNINTDSRRALQARIGLNWSKDDGGGWRTALNNNFTLKPGDTWEFQTGIDLSKSRSPAQYVTTVTDAGAESTFGERYIFAAIDQTTLDITERVSLTFTPDLTFELYLQPFVSSGDYLALKELRSPRTFDFLEYGKDTGTIERTDDGEYSIDPEGTGAGVFTVSDKDFNFRSLIGNAVLRWQWRPGSTLFLVWQQGRSHRLTAGPGDPEGTYGSFDFSQDTRDLFRIKPDNVFMIKVAYWLNP